MSDVVVAGETLVDFVPGSERPLPEVESFDRRPGGAPANVAVGLARLGHDPSFVTRVGADAFGDFLVDVLRTEGVGDRVQRDPDRKTTLAFVSHAPGDRGFSFYRDDTADTHLDTRGVGDAELAAASWLVLGGVMLASEPGRTAVLDLTERARERDCGVVVDPNGRRELWNSPTERREVTERLLGLADVVVTGADDLPWIPAERLVDHVRALGPSAVAVTRGADGARLVGGSDSPWGAVDVTHPGFDVDAVDATGAGDAFTAGLVASLLDGRPAAEGVAFANACGAAAVTGRGAMSALPDAAAVDDLRSRG